MSKNKYKFNPDTLSYEKIVVNRKGKIIRFIKQLTGITTIAAVILLFLSLFFDTPAERQQKRENKQLITQYRILNDKLHRIEQTMGQIKEHDNIIYRTIFEANPIPDNIRDAGFGGINRYKELESLSNAELVINTYKRVDKLIKQLDIQWKSYDEVFELAQKKEVLISSIPAISPISDKDLTRFASGFGYRIHPIYRTKKMHTGIDLTAPTGTKVYATGDGRVIKAGYSTGGYGKKVFIDHGFGYKTLYAHLNKVFVKKGQKVKRGELIGEVGNTGRSTAPHLHYEVRKNNKPENPVNYYYNDLTPEQYDEVIRISSQMNMSFD